jgi:hypothetical protein
MNRKRGPSVDEQLLRRIQTSKQAQAFAGKIERCIHKKGEGRELVKSLVEKWAELVKVRSYFPDLKDVFTPEAIFCIEYASRQTAEGSSDHSYPPVRVRDLLVHISNLVGNHDTDFKTLTRHYNNFVSRWSELREVLPLIDEQRKADGRLSGNKPLFIPTVASDPPTKKPRAKKTRDFELFRTKMVESYHAFGLHKGDHVIFKPDGTAPVGKLIGVYEEDRGAWFARVCLNDERGIYLVQNRGGRVWLGECKYKSFGPVIEIERASQVNAGRIAELKKRLEKIRRNDWDSICDTTRQYELEHELYDLEHPKEEDEMPDPGDDWPEVIGEGGASDE